MIYRLETPVATFELRREPLGMWDIWVNEMPTLTFATPEEAAEAVHKRESGYAIWDNADCASPEGLDGWEQVGES